MVATSLAAAFGALAGSAITGITNYYSNRLQQKREDTRERAGFYIEQKVEILTQLHGKISECHALLSAFVPHNMIEKNPRVETYDNKITEEQVTIANELTREIRTLIIKSQLYLTNEQKNKIHLSLMSLNHGMAVAVDDRTDSEQNMADSFSSRAEGMTDYLTDTDADVSDYYENIYSALNVIKTEVNEPIEAVSK